MPVAGVTGAVARARLGDERATFATAVQLGLLVRHAERRKATSRPDVAAPPRCEAIKVRPVPPAITLPSGCEVRAVA